MPGKASRGELLLTAEEKQMLEELSRSRTAPVREAERAKILLAYVEHRSIAEVMRRTGVGGSTVYKCIDKALAGGVVAGLKDTYHRPHPPEITDEAKAWVVSLACSKPKDHGLAAELWSISALSEFVSSHAVEAGHPRLAQAGKSTVWRILNERQIKPHKISYYLERRDPDSDQKMKEVLTVYHEFTGRVPMPHWRASASWPGW